ncbi:MAG: DUF6754 domain-containing protein [Candidatus Promineifilaceae bacterium]
MTFSTPSVIALLLILISAVVLVYLTRQYRSRPSVGLRSVEAYQALQRQAARAVESGRGIHFSLGRGSLGKATNPASLAAMSALQNLSKEAGASGKPPLVTSGDGTLFVASQDLIRGSYEELGRPGAYQSQTSRFVAPEDSPMTYGAAVSEIINTGEHGSNIVLGHIGSELAIIAEAADREHLEQIIGSDDITALAVAMSVTEDVIIGEELFAAAAYLQGEPAHIASLQLQDILRILVALIILIAALVSLLTG